MSSVTIDMLELNLTTKRLKIKRFCKKDIDQVFNLFQNQEVLYYYLPDPIETITKTELADFLSDWDDDASSFLFSCFLNEELVAIFSLEDFSLKQSRTECGIALVDQKFYGKGYAIEIVAAMVEYLFRKVNLNRIYIRYIEGNTRSYQLFSKLGFKYEGSLRQHVKRDHQYLNMNYMGLLKSEYLTMNNIEVCD
ncbi:MAG: GNAT family N-acetyltransferase [Clostridiaceae bacterium]|nr:GNAT family N-acetyltransferase [Clostridiaceae bacterium]